jgi:hypothetical protein
MGSFADLAAGIEGPFLDVAARFEYLRSVREQAACVCAQAVLDGESDDPWVVRWALRYRDAQAAIERAAEWQSAASGTVAAFIGWRGTVSRWVGGGRNA